MVSRLQGDIIQYCAHLCGIVYDCDIVNCISVYCSCLPYRRGFDFDAISYLLRDSGLVPCLVPHSLTSFVLAGM